LIIRRTQPSTKNKGSNANTKNAAPTAAKSCPPPESPINNCINQNNPTHLTLLHSGFVLLASSGYLQTLPVLSMCQL